MGVRHPTNALLPSFAMGQIFSCLTLSGPRNTLAALGCVAAGITPLASISAGLNDTGLSQCFDGSSPVACTQAHTGDTAPYPRQDARFGRDAQAAAGTLVKTGGGAAGFDFTALDAAGQPVSPGAHACVRDNVTGLVWSTETLASTWTAAAAAAAGYHHCGQTQGWRLPTRRELLSIVHNGSAQPAIDTVYFPATAPGAYWSGDVYGLDTTKAWAVDFADGSPLAQAQGADHSLRLVAAGAAVNQPPRITIANVHLDDKTAMAPYMAPEAAPYPHWRPQAMVMPGWASVAPGPANEAGQNLTATLTLLPVTGQKALEFDVPPTLDPATGKLSFTVKYTLEDYIDGSGAHLLNWVSSAGLARVQVELKDDGGTANGGVDTTTAIFEISLDSAPTALDVSVRGLWRSPCVPVTWRAWDADTDFRPPPSGTPMPAPRVTIQSVPRQGFLGEMQADGSLSVALTAAHKAGGYNWYGSACYHPFVPTFTGFDTFTLTVTDPDGNVSAPATISIEIHEN